MEFMVNGTYAVLYSQGYGEPTILDYIKVIGRKNNILSFKDRLGKCYTARIQNDGMSEYIKPSQYHNGKYKIWAEHTA